MKTIKVKATQNIFDSNGSIKGFGNKLEGEVFEVEEKRGLDLIEKGFLVKADKDDSNVSS